MHQDPIFTAIEYAAAAHAGQYRKGTPVPYIVHPMAVAQLMIEHRATQDMIIAAILHDTVEDTDVTVEDITERFGETVANFVDALSEPEKALPWEERKQHTITTMQSAHPEAVAIACADKIDNMRSTRRAYALVGDAVWDRFARPRDKQEWYYQSLLDVFSARITDARFAPLVLLLQHECDVVFG